MPTYQYVCGACNEPHEAVQSFSDDALTICPKCGAAELRKVYGSVGVVFKGSGFYRNDSRGNSSNASPTSAGPATDSSSSTAPSTTTTTAPTSSPSTSTPSAPASTGSPSPTSSNS